jgi:hypothetical protein
LYGILTKIAYTVKNNEGLLCLLHLYSPKHTSSHPGQGRLPGKCREVVSARTHDLMTSRRKSRERIANLRR